MLNEATSAMTNGIAVAGRLLIAGLAGLLICYHFYTLYQLFLGTGPSFGGDLEYVQAPLRLIIACSLLCVVFGKRWALWGMWAGITTLIATQYWAHFGHLPVEFTQGRHPLSYLKGFIFPTIITLTFLYSKPSTRTDAAPNRAEATTGTTTTGTPTKLRDAQDANSGIGNRKELAQRHLNQP